MRILDERATRVLCATSRRWKHSYCANMVEIRLRRSDPVARSDVSSSTQRSRRFDPEMTATISPRQAFDISLNGSQLVATLDLSMISCLPDIPLPNIKDRNKLDFFAKALTLVQTIWLILSLLVRVSRGYGVSQLEIITLAFALRSKTDVLIFPLVSGMTNQRWRQVLSIRQSNSYAMICWHAQDAT